MRSLENQLIGERIRSHRQRQNKRREDLAEALDVSVKFCGDIETGAKGMSVQTLVRLSTYLNLSTDYILFGDVSETNNQDFLRIIEKCPVKKRPFLKNIIIQIVTSYLEE